MQINSIKNTPSFGIKVPRNLAKTIQKEAKGTLIGDNAAAIVAHLKKIGSGDTKLKRFIFNKFPSAPGSKEPFYPNVSIVLETGLHGDKKTYYKSRSFDLYPPENISQVNTELTRLVDRAEEEYISRRIFDNIGKDFCKSGVTRLTDELSGHYGTSHGKYIELLKNELMKCFTK